MPETDWRQSEAGRALDEQLRSPETLAALTRIVQQAESIDVALRKASEIVEQSEGLVAIAADSTDEAIRTANDSGMDIEARLAAGLSLLEKLSRPRTASSLSAIVERIDQLEAAASFADQAPALTAALLDSFDEAVRHAERNGLGMEQMRGSLGNATLRLARFVQDGSLETLLESGVLDKEASEVVGLFGKALGRSRQAPARQLGFLGLARELKDPDLQRGLGFLATFGKELGRCLAEDPGNEPC